MTPTPTPETGLTLIQLAYCLAAKAHAGQYRRGGVTPYLTHVDAVMARAPKDPVSQAVAALHDVLEDTSITRIELVKWLADHSQLDEVLDGVIALTRNGPNPEAPNETYGEFIARIKVHRGGRWVRVKVADILSNLADQPTDAQIRRYAAALIVLLS